MLIKPRQASFIYGMNKTEANYAYQLEMLKKAEQILEWRFEPLKFKLATRTFYTPDFLVVKEECLEIHEVKGFWKDDARVKIKVAAQMYPWFKWAAVQWKRKQWIYEYF